jgi:sugar (pentulose or hexulose) kinase
MRRATQPLFLGIDLDGSTARGVLVDPARRAVVAHSSAAGGESRSNDDEGALDRQCELLREVVRGCVSRHVGKDAPIVGIAIGIPDAAIRSATFRQLDSALRSASDPRCLDRDAADWLGFEPDTRVAPLLPRSILAAIGAGATHEGSAFVRFAPRSLAVASTSAQIVDPEALIEYVDHPLTGSFVTWSRENGESILDELRTGFSTTDDLDSSILDAAAAAVPPGAFGVRVLPFLRRERFASHREDGAAILGLTHDHFRASVVQRAALEALAFEIAIGVDRMRALGVPIDLIRFGCAPHSDALRRWLVATTCETPVVAVTTSDLEARGAALVAASIALREAGDGGTLDDLAQEFNPPAGEVTEPDGDSVRLYRSLAERHHASVRRVFRRHHARRPSTSPMETDSRGRRQGRLFEH